MESDIKSLIRKRLISDDTEAKMQTFLKSNVTRMTFYSLNPLDLLNRTDTRIE